MVFKKMGEAISKIFLGREEVVDEEIIELCYNKYFRQTVANFYQAICLTVEEINRRQGSTQFRIPSATVIERIRKKCKIKEGIPLKKEKVREIISELTHETAITGLGATDTLFYLFGVPATALFNKRRIKPQAISDDVFIPGVTSATILVLSKFNRI
ncbi:uncharacterized protein LOC132607557 [Lycium barbarum]|uniref:uncharacterized protein LOC132607557 n=1 Tax=Lycium barbarum TaxID=112863 RepID=UPI00293E6B81|nr:uncharacterized protein LOC132607557 [Lycium barbarum]